MNQVSADDLSSLGHDLRRPESVLATAAGDLFTSNAAGGVSHLHPDGSHSQYLGQTDDLSDIVHPNGITLEPDGSFLLAHLGQTEGGVFRLHRDGTLVPELREVEGTELPPTNHVIRDAQGRMWVTVSTTMSPRDTDFRPDAHRGYVVLDDGRGARVVAEGLGFTNECCPSQDGRWLYVNETFTRRTSRFPVSEDGVLGDKEVIAEFGPGEFPDGLALDVDGGVWVVCVVSNRVLRIAPDGKVGTWLDAGSQAHVDSVEPIYLAGDMRADQIAGRGESVLGQVSSLAFGGPDRRTVYLGSLRNEHILHAPSTVAGVEPPHWRFGG
ncbi:SMP-30/gluconolactonase/LRE family protein [Pseudonocardia sp. KRD291]|uniref:SMP-30/gluconolactonase/LRE family protein n=1 Tax=Pseudonocardia sp. KRD291 TaxID=2792007 RepID=UPI001C49E6F4|nr:SMP-30/gluconolactonase/LRE family protein [Pseudonocardia sp. KRD291]MBW0104805.1 SMP-30/gluconolactonase/LRE family protein [Pseudonocardia sp. KRD291]